MAEEPATPLDPAEAFDAVGNEVRIDILGALGGSGGGPLSFSELRDAVGTSDSGRFNYHLQELTGHFVERGDGGYSLRYPGWKVAYAVLAGTFNERAHMDPVAVEGECHSCGAAALVAAYEDERFSVRCESCANLVLEVPFPPSAVADRDPEAVVDAFDRWSTSQARLASDGVCPECAGEMVGSVRTDVPDGFDHEALAEFACTVCRRHAVMTFGAVAIHHPSVLAFYHRRDESPRRRPYWTVPQVVTDRYTDVTSTDPWRVRVEFAAAGDVLETELDGTADVVETTVTER
ncbi:MAG: helix-turn-helix domain-containing protein [Halobacteriaceae archaeon]